MKFRRSLSLLLTFAMLFALATPFASATGDILEMVVPTITVESKAEIAGSTVSVEVKIENNPGILGATLKFEYDDALTLVDAKSGDAFSALTMTKPGKFTSPCKFAWDGQELSSEDIKDGTILTLQFKIPDDAEGGEEYAIDVSYTSGDIFDANVAPIEIATVGGVISVIDYVPGDLNSDGSVNTGDVILLRRHVVGGYEQNINEAAGDVDSNGVHNTGDVILIRRYIVGGYGVELNPSVPQCNHTMEAVEYKAPSCEETGNIAFWYCTKCNKSYADATGNTSIKHEDTLIDATGHTVVIDAAVAPTYDATGLTEGKHCSVCKKVIVAQTVVPKLETTEHSIIYHIDDNDAYLQSIAIENPNPAAYSEEKGLTLKNLSVNGYNFLGWYTMQSGGTHVTKIEAGETGNKELYARWEKVTYTISFASDMQPIESITYQTGESMTLPTPSLDKYRFIGWCDADGKMWDSIPAGTYGNIMLYANWASNRNKAEAVKKLDDPIIFEDSENGLILFTYEIGQIKNVPLFTTLKLQTANGIITTIEQTNTKEISETNAKTIAQTISNATTNSSSWTLSKDWNNITQLSEVYSDLTEERREEIETKAKSETDTWNVGKSNGGSSSNIKVGGDSHTYSKNNGHSSSNTDEEGSNYSLKVGGEGSVGFKGVGSAKVYGEIEGGEEKKSVKTGTSSDSESNDWDEYNSSTDTSESHWNTSDGFTDSNTTSESKTIANIFSKIITKQYGYGETYSEGGSNSESQALASTDSKSDEFSSTLTYHTSEIETKTTSFTSTGETKGSYRMVMGGTIHVFAVVGYDVSTASYFVYTYNVLDDHTEEYLDYSNDDSFNDYETSILPFEVPVFVNDYVNYKIVKTDGLTLDVDTGMIVDYEPTARDSETGEIIPDEIVVIPSYIRVDNNDGTYKSVKVKGIAPGLFKDNKDIVAVQLGDYITEIPDSTFEGCSNLKYIIAPGVTKIGNNAFAGCTSLKPFTVPVEITELGENVFEEVPEIEVEAGASGIARAAVASGADNIIMDISQIPEDDVENLELTVGNINSFELRGKEKVYKGLCVKSDAETTIINGITFTENTKIPLELSSPKVTLDTVTINADGLALVLKDENTKLTLNRTIGLTSLSGNAMLCKNAEFASLTTGILGKLAVTGNVLVCGDEINGTYINVTDGEIKYITEDEFDNYLSRSMIRFDANGGECNTDVLYVKNGSAVGELPVPTKDGERFLGWYTEDGELIDSDTVLSDSSAITVCARWELSKFTASWNAGTGYTIKVTRTSSPYQNASIGAIASGDNVYFGDELIVTYAAATGYDLKTTGTKAITVTRDITKDDIYATASVKKYAVSWSSVTGCTIKVTRTASPYQGASTGALVNGAAIYYGDKLSVSYTAASEYNILKKGITSITVTGNVTKSQIYATTERLGVWYRNINGISADRVKYNLDFYYIGADMHIKGYVYDAFNYPATMRLDANSQHAKVTHQKDKNCPCGWDGCIHGIDWIISGYFSSGFKNEIPALHTWATGYPDPIALK